MTQKTTSGEEEFCKNREHYKNYCNKHSSNRDITCEECNKNFSRNCRIDAETSLLLKQSMPNQKTTNEEYRDLLPCVDMEIYRPLEKMLSNLTRKEIGISIAIDFIATLILQKQKEVLEECLPEKKELYGKDPNGKTRAIGFNLYRSQIIKNAKEKFNINL